MYLSHRGCAVPWVSRTEIKESRIEKILSRKARILEHTCPIEDTLSYGCPVLVPLRACISSG